MTPLTVPVTPVTVPLAAATVPVMPVTIPVAGPETCPWPPALPDPVPPPEPVPEVDGGAMARAVVSGVHAALHRASALGFCLLEEQAVLGLGWYGAWLVLASTLWKRIAKRFLVSVDTRVAAYFALPLDSSAPW